MQRIAVVGVMDWTQGFQPAKVSRRHANFVRQTDFWLDEAVLAEQRGDNSTANGWLNLALVFEAKDRKRPAA